MTLSGRARALARDLVRHFERTKPSGRFTASYISLTGEEAILAALEETRREALEEAAQSAQAEHDKEAAHVASETFEMRGQTAICLGALRARDAILALIDASWRGGTEGG